MDKILRGLSLARDPLCRQNILLYTAELGLLIAF